MAILGIDEVGRGPLAGPLVVGAVVLPDKKPEWVGELRDSKKLAAKKREKLAAIIEQEAPAYGLGWVTPVEIDELGMSEALRIATRRAVLEVQGKKVAFSQVIIDGKTNFLIGTALAKYTSTAVKADDFIKEVSAASIVAKCARDAYMTKVGAQYAGYGFEKHMGYGTAAHMAAIREKGICPEHRRSFEPIKSMVGFERAECVVKNTTMIGARGEDAVCEYLIRNGHEICERNFKTYYYEIDIVSVCNGVMYFTEVKTRKDGRRGGGMAAVDANKLQQMKFAAECFVKYRGWNGDMMLAAASVNGKYEVEEWMPIR
ncbi:ribonuclease HII [Candidatus Saccharibacteria bacterium]|nr:ribonuclease HII [Candidatus Saccharibacteria bacterium]